MLRSALQEDPLNCGLLDDAVLRPKPKDKLVILGMAGRHGTSFAALLIAKPPGLEDGGFRRGVSGKILLDRYNSGATLVGARVARFDPSWVHGRDQNPDVATLQSQKVAVIGVGSLGSTVADLLAKAGVGNLMLLDSDLFLSVNSSRHLLGAPAIGFNKAEAVASNIASRFPHLTVTASQAFRDDPPVIALLRSANLIISLTGNWPAESLLDSIWKSDPSLPSALYGWTEPHAAAGHALALMRAGGCLSCILDDLGKVRIPVTHWLKNTMLRVPACGEMFQPYGATALAFISAMVADLALDILLGHTSQSTHRVWMADAKLLASAQGGLNPAWREAHGSPADGGELREVAMPPSCEHCRVAR